MHVGRTASMPRAVHMPGKTWESFQLSPQADFEVLREQWTNTKAELSASWLSAEGMPNKQTEPLGKNWEPYWIQAWRKSLFNHYLLLILPISGHKWWRMDRCYRVSSEKSLKQTTKTVTAENPRKRGDADFHCCNNILFKMFGFLSFFFFKKCSRHARSKKIWPISMKKATETVPDIWLNYTKTLNQLFKICSRN